MPLLFHPVEVVYFVARNWHIAWGRSSGAGLRLAAAAVETGHGENDAGRAESEREQDARIEKA
jgi:hypothetical protein